MLPVVSADTIYSFAQSASEYSLEEITDDFWDYLSQTNPILLEYIIGFSDKLNKDNMRSLFLSGIYTAITLLRRQDEAEELNRMFGEEE